jgi:hypothetical protein
MLQILANWSMSDIQRIRVFRMHGVFISLFHHDVEQEISKMNNKYQKICVFILGSIEKKVPRRHQSFSEGSTLSAVDRKLL